MEAANYEIHVAQARAKAKAIEHEAELILSSSNIKVKEAELEAKRKYEDRTITLKKEHSEKMLELDKKERGYKEELRKITKDREDLQLFQNNANALFDEGAQLKEEYTTKVNEALLVLERSSGLTQNEAKEIVLAKVEEQSRAEIAHTVRRLEEEAKQDIKRRVNYILAQATTRFAGEFAAERLINVVNIKDDELKGRIIGKEGRNIKTLEMLLGVDIIIDDTPNAIILSSFNLYRRAIATKVIELLVQDGRIQPARIEGIYEKVKDEFDQSAGMLFRMVPVELFPKYNNVRESTNRIRAGEPAVRQQHTGIPRQINGGGSGNGRDSRLDKIPCRVTQGCGGNTIFNSIVQRDITDASRNLFNQTGHTGIFLHTQSHGPPDHGPRTDIFFPVGADLRKIIGQKKCCSTAFRTMDHRNFQWFDVGGGVDLSDSIIRPVRDPPHKNIRQQ